MSLISKITESIKNAFSKTWSKFDFSFFSKFGNSLIFTALLPNIKKSFLLINLGKTYCSISEIAIQKKQNVIKGRWFLRLPDSLDGLKDFWNDLFTETLKISPTDCRLVIPRSTVSVRNISLPSTDTRELEEMSRFQAQRLAPFEPGNLISDFQVTECKDVDNNTSINLTMANKQSVLEYIGSLKAVCKIVTQANVSSDFIFSYILEDEKTKPYVTDSTSLIIDTDYEITTLLISSSGKLLYSRALNHGLFEIRENQDEAFIAEWCKELVKEIENTVSAFNNDFKGYSIDYAIITGPGIVNKIGEVLRTEIKLPVIIHQTDLETNEINGSQNEYDDYVSTSTLMGFLSGSLHKCINLLPTEIIQEKKTRQLYRDLIRTCALLVLIILLSSLYISQRISQKSVYLENLRQQIEATSDLSSNIESVRQQTRLIHKHANAESSVLDILLEIHQLAPGNIHIDYFDYSTQKRIVIKGNSKTLENALTFVDKLKQTSLLSTVNLDYANNENSNSDFKTRFQVSGIPLDN